MFGRTKKEELLSKMDAGIQRELNEKALLPNSRDEIPDAKNTLRIMKEALIIVMVFNTNHKLPFENIITAHERLQRL